MSTTLTLDDARARFGELIHQPTQTYMYFDDGPWIWRPEFENRNVVRYRRYPQPRSELKVTWRGRKG